MKKEIGCLYYHKNWKCVGMIAQTKMYETRTFVRMYVLRKTKEFPSFLLEFKLLSVNSNELSTYWTKL